MVSEFIVCIKNRHGRWAQVLLNAPERPPLLHEIRANRQSIERWKTREIPEAGIVDISKTCLGRTIDTRAPNTLIVKWIRQNETYLTEALTGYEVKDRPNRTLEFRLAVVYDLKKYNPSDVEIFFAEGTGYAKWLTKDELGKLVQLDMVTPFLRSLQPLL